ncbi:hypothetical protein D3C86_1815170 [compost metagenome]
MALPVARHVILMAKRHVNLTHRRTVERHVLADISACAQHAGCRFQLVDQDRVIIFPAGEIHRLTRHDIQIFKMWRRHVDDVQRRQGFLPNGDKFSG